MYFHVFAYISVYVHVYFHILFVRDSRIFMHFYMFLYMFDVFFVDLSYILYCMFHAELATKNADAEWNLPSFNI